MLSYCSGEIVLILLMKQQHRTKSNEHYKQHKLLPNSSLQKIKQSLPLNHPKNNITTHRFVRYPSSEAKSEHKNKAEIVKNLIDDYFQRQVPFQKTAGLFSRTRHYENNRMAKRIKNRSQLAPIQTSPNNSPIQTNPNNSPNKHKMAVLPNLQHKDQQKQTHVLPPIRELTEDCEQMKQHNESMLRSSLTSTSFYFRSSSVFSEYLNPEMQARQTRVKTFENEIITMYIILENGHPIGRLKEFKQRGESVLTRQLKMMSHNVPRIWEQSRINAVTFQTGMDVPLKDQLYKIKPDELNPSHLRIYPRSLFKKLKANRCEQLKILLRTFCQDMLKLQGKVINNKLNLANLFLKDDRLVIAEWGHSSFRETFDIQLNKFESRQKGHLQGQHSWLVSPEYLAPQIITDIIGQQTMDIWLMDSSPDIWSLGLVLLQILTLIPIWTTNKCCVVGKPSIIRNGILATSGRDLHKLHQKQISIQKTAKRCLDAQLQREEQQLSSLIVRMLDPNPNTRISWQQIIATL